MGTTDADGTLRTVDATFQPFGRNCSEGGQQEATAGTVTSSVVADTLVEGTYDLLFGRSRVQGSFSTPTCVLCAPPRRHGPACGSDGEPPGPCSRARAVRGRYEPEAAVRDWEGWGWRCR